MRETLLYQNHEMANVHNTNAASLKKESMHAQKMVKQECVRIFGITMTINTEQGRI